MTVTIYYHPEGYTTTGPSLMGRNAAGESFLKGFILYNTGSEYWIKIQNIEHANQFLNTLRAFGRNDPVNIIQNQNLNDISKSGVIYYPGPGLAEHAFQRAYFGHNLWSLCGITHTTSSARAMDAIVDLISAPIQPWDAIICTSTAVKDNVIRVLQSQIDYLSDRLGITKVTLPKLPIIPLGVHTKDFDFNEKNKTSARKELGISEDTIVVLFMGRLSFHAKAHPLGMYQALELATKATKKNILLIECGWHANEHISRAFSEAARLACPSVEVKNLDGRIANNRNNAWACADIFCSLSDNIQETFGLVPIEAMAAGLPVVVSDWDGYRDTVRDGIDGFRISTLMPQAGSGGDLSKRYGLEIDTYDMYCGFSSTLVSVDISATAKSLELLINSNELRKNMGQAGKERAKRIYDWKHIINQYEALWSELSEIRKLGSKDLKFLNHPWPARMDPFHAFASYPTYTLKSDTILELAENDFFKAKARIKEYRKLAMVNYVNIILPSDHEIDLVLETAQYGPSSALGLLKNIDANRKPFVFRSLVWFIKVGILRHCL